MCAALLDAIVELFNIFILINLTIMWNPTTGIGEFWKKLFF